LARVKWINESSGVEQKRSNGGLVCESGSETVVKRGEGAMRGREKMLSLLDGGSGDGRRRR